MRRLRIIRHDDAENRWRVVHSDAAPRLWPHVEAYADYSDSRFALLDAFFERRLADATLPCREIAWAWSRLVKAPAPRIDRLPLEIGWSQRRLAAGFVRHVGHPRRTILRLARFQRLIARIDDVSPDGWAQRVLDAGYFDQPHLIHEFQAFAGMTPRRYAARLLPDGGGLVEG